MFGFALNHMTMAKASFAELLTTVEALQCVGIEVRHDRGEPLFDGLSALCTSCQLATADFHPVAA